MATFGVKLNNYESFHRQGVFISRDKQPSYDTIFLSDETPNDSFVELHEAS
jgi:hypothetical protein